jgi:NAD(P)H-dependent flavin oxidoreductase YrpB (nitropropane dioxygenase family)
MVHTALCDVLGMRHPIMCAGMGGVTGAELASAVSNAGGCGTIGAIGLSPDGLRAEIQRLRGMLDDESFPYGVDLLLPQVGGSARKTNKDYTGGMLNDLVDVMFDERIPLFVCAVGVPPKWVVDKLHSVGTVVMSMVGAPKHVKGCLRSGVDIICAQGTEAGAHTGDIGTMVLLPQVVDACAGKAIVVGAGGIGDGRAVAACMALGAAGAWIGSRFLASPEANVHDAYKQAVLAGSTMDTIRTEIFTGRPLRVLKNDYVMGWEARIDEKKKLLASGVIPRNADADKIGKNNSVPSSGYWKNVIGKPGSQPDGSAVAVGQGVGAINKIMPAKDIVDEIIADLVTTVKAFQGMAAEEALIAKPRL